MSGVLVVNVLSTTRSSVRCRRALLSLDDVTKYVPSPDSCRSVTWPLWAFSLAWISSPVLLSNSATLPDSWPVMMSADRGAKTATVALDPIGLNMTSGSRLSARWGEDQRGARTVQPKGGARASGCEGEGRTLCGLLPVEAVDADGAHETATLLRDAEEHRVVLAAEARRRTQGGRERRSSVSSSAHAELRASQQGERATHFHATRLTAVGNSQV